MNLYKALFFVLTIAVFTVSCKKETKIEDKIEDEIGEDIDNY